MCRYGIMYVAKHTAKQVAEQVAKHTAEYTADHTAEQVAEYTADHTAKQVCNHVRRRATPPSVSCYKKSIILYNIKSFNPNEGNPINTPNTTIRGVPLIQVERINI